MTAAVAEHAAAVELAAAPQVVAAAAAAAAQVAAVPQQQAQPSPPGLTFDSAPEAPPADGGDVESLRRKVRKLAKRVAALESERAGESD